MLFNSLTFLAFLPTTFMVYWALHRDLRLQNAFVLVASYVFYGWWDWRFLGLIAFSTVLDFSVGLALGRTEAERARRGLIGLSVAANLGLLGFFKYFNFFSESFADVLRAIGFSVNEVTLDIVLPVGISFYTFQTLSYTIDVYRRQLEPTRDPIAFAAYVSFFPQLVAGPIERATSLLPQFQSRRALNVEQARDGLRQILWGMFKKVAVADTCGVVADDIFSGYAGYSTLTLWIGAGLFAIQIYGDFSGYSDIAIGTARLFGFELRRNFHYPYFSRDISEFWRRWHISLSTWFRDYVYIPLGGSRTSRGRAFRNVLIVFLISGLWHGANWTFIMWGLINALLFLPLFLSGKNRVHVGPIAPGRFLPTASEALRIAATFLVTLVAWVFFRSPTISAAVDYVTRMFIPADSSALRFSSYGIGLACVMLTWEWIQREREHGLAEASRFPSFLRYSGYALLITLIIRSSDVQREFIYFQF